MKMTVKAGLAGLAAAALLLSGVSATASAAPAPTQTAGQCTQTTANDLVAALRKPGLSRKARQNLIKAASTKVQKTCAKLPRTLPPTTPATPTPPTPTPTTVPYTPTAAPELEPGQYTVTTDGGYSDHLVPFSSAASGLHAVCSHSEKDALVSSALNDPAHIATGPITESRDGESYQGATVGFKNTTGARQYIAITVVCQTYVPPPPPVKTDVTAAYADLVSPPADRVIDDGRYLVFYYDNREIPADAVRSDPFSGEGPAVFTIDRVCPVGLGDGGYRGGYDAANPANQGTMSGETINNHEGFVYHYASTTTAADPRGISYNNGCSRPR